MVEVCGKNVIESLTIEGLSKLIGDKKKESITVVVIRSKEMQRKFKQLTATEENFSQNKASEGLKGEVQSSSMQSRQLQQQESVVYRGSI